MLTRSPPEAQQEGKFVLINQWQIEIKSENTLLILCLVNVWSIWQESLWQCEYCNEAQVLLIVAGPHQTQSHPTSLFIVQFGSLETLHIWARMQERHTVFGGKSTPTPWTSWPTKKYLASKIDSVNSIAAQRLGSRLTTRELGARCAECTWMMWWSGCSRIMRMKAKLTQTHKVWVSIRVPSMPPAGLLEVAKCQSTTLKLPLCHPSQTMALTHVSLKLPPQLPAAILQQVHH